MSTTSCERCEDFAADARKVLSQRCAPDERHCSCVPHLRAEIDRLTAERAAVRAALVDSGTEPVTEDMGRLAALVAAQLADEVATIAHLEQEIGRLQSALGGEIAARQAAEVALEEARLTLAAEQGRAEGAPSEGWICERIHRGRPTWLRRAIVQGYDGTFYVEYAPIGIDGWFWCFQSADVQTAFQPANTARAAMLAADASK